MKRLEQSQWATRKVMKAMNIKGKIVQSVMII